nr:putative ribonuclease H-like domain-containing protein [Tanacetum cinerariifolium]
MKKMYCLVVTNDYSRLTWVFFLGTKDETSGILKSFITRIENLVDHKVMMIRCDNGTEFKNMEGKKLKDLKNRSFDSIQKMFDKAFNRVNTFVDFKIELDEGSSKRAGEELTEEISKKQKVDDDKEIAELKQLMGIIPNKEEVAIDAIPLDVKSLKIID